MSKFRQNLAKILLVAVVVTQLFGAAIVAYPQRAEAFISIIAPGTGALAGSSALTTVPIQERFSWHKFTDDIFTNLMLGVAHTFAQKFMLDFVNKLTEKYKVRNFLYYDQVLSNYYLTNFLRDKIADPNLRQIFDLMHAGYITGQPTGTVGGPDPRQALIPRLKRAISDLYYARGGIDEQAVLNPDPNVSNSEYFLTAYHYWMSNPGFTERNLRGQFGEFQSHATTAAQLEVLVGNGLKAGRFVGGVCQIAGDTEGNSTTIATPAECEAAGGVWQESALDQARSFIDNPTTFVDKWMQSMVQELTGSNFNPNNFWFVIGNAFGRFLINQLFVDSPTGVLNEDPRAYVPLDPAVGESSSQVPLTVDIDGDGIVDGYDVDGDGDIDNCVYGGTAPNCSASGSLGGGGGGGGGSNDVCEGIQATPNYQNDLRSAQTEVNNTNPNGIADALNTEENARIYLNEVADVLRSRGFNASTDVLNGNDRPNSGDLIAIWSTGEPFAERYDAVIDVGGGTMTMREAATAGYVGDVPIDGCIP